MSDEKVLEWASVETKGLWLILFWENIDSALHIFVLIQNALWVASNISNRNTASRIDFEPDTVLHKLENC